MEDQLPGTGASGEVTILRRIYTEYSIRAAPPMEVEWHGTLITITKPMRASGRAGPAAGPAQRRATNSNSGGRKGYFGRVELGERPSLQRYFTKIRRRAHVGVGGRALSCFMESKRSYNRTGTFVELNILGSFILLCRAGRRGSVGKALDSHS